MNSKLIKEKIIKLKKYEIKFIKSDNNYKKSKTKKKIEKKKSKESNFNSISLCINDFNYSKNYNANYFNQNKIMCVDNIAINGY